MKTSTTILFVLSVLVLNAQQKFSAGIQLEGIYSTPKNLSIISTMESSFGTGGGIYLHKLLHNSILQNSF